MGLVHGARRRIACVLYVPFLCACWGRIGPGLCVGCVWFKGGECPDTQPGKVSLAHYRAARSSLCVRVRVLTFVLCGPECESHWPVRRAGRSVGRGRGRVESGSSER